MLFAVHMAEFHHLDTPLFVATIQCESNFSPTALGDGGTSFGIAQFHTLSKWHMTKKQALDPYFAISKMAEEWETEAHGGASNWSCYKLITERLKYLNLALQ